MFRGEPELGHEMLVVNRSSEPVFIYSYDVVCAQVPSRGDQDSSSFRTAASSGSTRVVAVTQMISTDTPK